LTPPVRFGVRVATPLASNVADPSAVAPLIKVTVPVGGTPVALFKTVDTRTTCGVEPVVFEEPRLVVVGMRPTVSLIAAEVLGASAGSPR
jgi:hypothetical protein